MSKTDGVWPARRSGSTNSRRALLHILQGSHKDNLRLEVTRKAMIHIMGDLRETTAEMQRREQELREKTGAARPGGESSLR